MFVVFQVNFTTYPCLPLSKKMITDMVYLSLMLERMVRFLTKVNLC